MAVFPIAPSSKFIVVSPSDTAVLTWNGDSFSTKAIMAGVAGNIAVKDEVDTSVTIVGLAAGVMYPIETNLILSTGTTATSITAFF